MGMRVKGIIKIYAGMLIFLIMTACAPVISQQALDEVEGGINFEDVLKNPDPYMGRILLLGGFIIETRNLPERTVIMVLQSPLGFRKEPAEDKNSKGRFIISVPGFLDPAIYRPARKVTVVGSVSGKEVRPLGEIKYTYPVILKKEIYLWPAEQSARTEPRVHFGVGIGIGF